MNSKSELDSANNQSIESSLLRHTDDLVSIVDKNYIYRAISRGYEIFFGCTQQDILGKSVSEVHGEEVFKQAIKPALDQTLAGEYVHFQFSRPNHAGEIRNLDSMHTIYSGPLTEGDGVAVVVRDITETVKANDALRNERQLLNTIIDSIPDFIFTKTPDGVYQTCNKSFAEFLGLPKEQIIGKTDYELMSKASAKYIAQRDAEVRNNQDAQRDDEWVTYQDGRRRLLDMHKMPLINENNTDLGILGVGRNVTYEREAEQKLLMAALVFDSTPDPCIILEETGLIVSSNDAAQNQFSNLQNKDQSQHISDIFYCAEANLQDLNSLSIENGNWCGEVYSNDNDNHLATINLVQGQARQADKYVLMIRDEGTHQSFADNLKDKAYQDALTGLPNRRLFFSRLESALIRAERQFTQLAVLYIDLNNFKPINDQHGHSTGDKALIQVANRLKIQFRSSDTLARLGGDEFVALVNIETKSQASIIAEKVLSNLQTELDLGSNIRPTISASIGISIFPSNAGTAEELVHKADEAMYKAKRDPNLHYLISEN
jgi:diguanylate cyclase (GGDEF)-like protein/PAS domain S-box-containing protein